MIDESMGKVIGMAMAYGVSSLGLLLAYYNYRKRIVKAEKIFTGVAWAIISTTLLVIVVAVFLVVMLARAGAPAPTASSDAARLEVTAPGEGPAVSTASETAEQAGAPALSRIKTTPRDRGALSLIGLFLPAIIFLFSLWVTWALYRHFARQLTEEREPGK